MVLAMLAPAPHMTDFADLLELPIQGETEQDVPGWEDLKAFLETSIGLTAGWPQDEFRKLYNHYLKRFPIHYFSKKTIPEIDFALYFPINAPRMGLNHDRYMIVIKPKGEPMKIGHRKIGTQIKSRKNFHYLTHKIIAEGLRGVDILDAREIEAACSDIDKLYKYRSARFHSFLARAERKFHKTRYRQFFQGQWPKIQAFLDNRDRIYLELLIERVRTEHVSFEAAHVAAMISPRQNIDVYNWITGGNGPNALRNRIQVSRAFPWLAGALTHKPQNRTIRRDTPTGFSSVTIHVGTTHTDLEKVIDHGEELIPALQEAFTDSNDAQLIRASTVRKMLGQQIAADHQNLHVVGKTLQGIDRYAPGVVLEAGYFDRIVQAAQNGEGSYAYLNSSFYEILGAMTPEERNNFFNSKLHRNAYGNTQHFLVEVYRKLVLPYFTAKAIEYGVPLSDMAERYIKGDLDKDSFISRNNGQIRHPPHLRPFGNMSFMNMVRLSEAWHDTDNQKRYVSRRFAVEELSSDIRWPALTDELTMNGIKITPRQSLSELMDEWKDMNHCIHSFAPNCLGLQNDNRFPNSQVFSHIFKMAAGKTRATLGLFEVRPLNGGPPSLHMDHIENRRTHRNIERHAPADAPETVAAKLFFNQIAEGKIPINWSRLDNEREEMRKGRQVDNIFIEIGFDPRDPIKRELAYLILRQYLPDRLRTASYAEFIYRMDFEDEARRLLTMPLGPHNNVYTLNHVHT